MSSTRSTYKSTLSSAGGVGGSQIWEERITESGRGVHSMECDVRLTRVVGWATQTKASNYVYGLRAIEKDMYMFTGAGFLL